MNGRIKELESQCWVTFKDGLPWFDYVKFAELVVEDCREVMIKVYRSTPLDLCGPLLVADEEIMKHFYGVEE